MYWLSPLLFRADYFVKRLVRTVYPIGDEIPSCEVEGKREAELIPGGNGSVRFYHNVFKWIAPIHLLTSSKGMYLRRESCSFVKSQGIKLQWTNERVVFVCHGRAIILLFQLHKRSAADVSQLQGISWTRRACDFPFCGCKYQRPIINARLCFFTLQVKWAFSCKFL